MARKPTPWERFDYVPRPLNSEEAIWSQPGRGRAFYCNAQELERSVSDEEKSATPEEAHLFVEAEIFSQVKRNRYERYLHSDAWRRVRELVLHRAKYRCEGCGIRDATEAHHMTYAHLGNEFLWELRAVCEFCHQRFHAERQTEAAR